MYSRVGIFSIFLILYHLSFSQESIPGKEIICPLDPNESDLKIERPLLKSQDGISLLGVQSANIIVTYNGFTPEAQQAFQFAVDIWASLIESDVDIYVEANWVNLGTNVLGSARATTFYRNFNNAPLPFVYYPVALAEKLAGQHLNQAGNPDITTSFNSSFADWYFGTDGNANGKYDFVTIVLHELGHGLGFSAAGVTFGENESDWDLGGYPAMYTPYIEDGDGLNILLVPNNSPELSDYLQSNDLFIGSGSVVAANSGGPARLYCPNTFNQGSSISHWDDGTFNNSENALMTHALAKGESIHDPGPITLSLLEDIGWSIPPAPVNDDISVTNMTLSDNSVIPGANILVSCDHVYSGSTSDDNLNNPSVGYYLSTNANFDAGDIFLGDDLSSVGNDKPSESENESLTIPSNTPPGEYYLVFFSDYLDVVDEIHELNNFGYLPITVEPIYLSVNPLIQNIPSNSGNTSFDVATNLDSFLVDVNADWLTPSINSDQIMVDYEANLTIEERSATITVTGNEISDIELTIVQAPGDPFLTISPASINVSYTAGNSNFSVDTNLPDFEILASHDWLDISKNGNTIEVNYQENKTLSERVGIVSVSGDGVADQEVTIVQEPGMPYLTISPSNKNASFENGNTFFDIETNLEEITVTTDADWLTLTTQIDQLTVDFDENGSIDERTATIYVNGNGVDEQILTIVQEGSPPYLNISATEILVGNDEGDTSFNVDTNLPSYDVEVEASWVHVDISDSIVTLHYDSNSLISERQVNIKVSGSGIADQLIAFTQEAGDPFIEIASLISYAVSDSGRISISVHTNLSDIVVEENEEWLAIVEFSPTNIEVSLDRNIAIEPRTGYLTVFGNGVSDISLEITQESADPYLTVSPGNATVDHDAGSVEFATSTNLPDVSLSSDADWLEINLDEGILTVDYQENIVANPRNALITLSGDNVKDQEIKLTQNGAPPYLSASIDMIETDKESSSTDVAIHTNLTDLDVQKDVDWVSFTITHDTLSIQVEENKTVNERTGSLILTGDGVEDIVIRVMQSAGEAYLLLSTNVVEIPDKAGEDQVTMETNLSDINVESDEDWLIPQVENSILTFSYSENHSFEVRNAHIVISGPAIEKQSISILQRGKTAFLTFHQNSIEAGSEGGSVELALETNLEEFYIENEIEWLQVEITDDSIVFTFEENKQFEPRNGELLVKGEYVADQTLFVTQKPAIPYLTVEDDEIILEPGPGKYIIPMETNLADFQIEKDADWFSVNRINDTLEIVYDKNGEQSERFAQINLTHYLIEDLTILVSQRAAIVSGIESGPAFSIYPNPAKDTFHFTLPESNQNQTTRIIICDLNGKPVMTGSIYPTIDKQYQFNVHSLKSGMYTLTVENGSDNKIYRSKLMIR